MLVEGHRNIYSYPIIQQTRIALLLNNKQDNCKGLLLVGERLRQTKYALQTNPKKVARGFGACV